MELFSIIKHIIFVHKKNYHCVEVFSLSSCISLRQVKSSGIKLRGLIVFGIYFLTNKVYKQNIFNVIIKTFVGWIFLLQMHFNMFVNFVHKGACVCAIRIT